MEKQFPLHRKSDRCPFCSGERPLPEPAPRGEPAREVGLPEFLAELRRNFRYDVEASTSFTAEPVWAEAVAP